MNIQNLIESLKEHRNAVGDEMIQKMDFDQLEKDLNEAVCALSTLDRKEKLCEKLLYDFKSEIKKMTLAVSRVKGELNSCGLVEKLLSSPDLSFEDLIFLREKVKEEFNQSFSSSPHFRVMVDHGESNFRISEFKTGMKT
ncbi:MAG: hypothetical protein KAW52_06330 [candidate division Zixibacteria bacterium]|nr:hypothetical protein [candidate division Zixibacteria bacterium]